MNQYKCDVLVIGGGPAGMMAAGRAAENGAKVILLEKNNRLGVKLLITGKGRCNITNADSNIRNLVEKYGKNGRFLFSALNSFGVDDIIRFFADRGVAIKVERGSRVFPVSDVSMDVLNALIDYLKQGKVKVQTKAEVKEIVAENGNIDKVKLQSGEEIKAGKYIIATGGKSYPATGSTGDGYRWLEKLGHTILKPEPSLVPVVTKENIVRDLEGLSLKKVEISVYQEKKKQDSRFGEAIFTGNGLSGPIILDMSKKIAELLNNGSVKMRIDFKPALTSQNLDKRIQEDFKKYQNKQFKNALDDLLPQKMIPVVIRLSKIDPVKQVNVVTKEERGRIIKLLKEFELEISKTEGFERAIVTAGGVDLKEVEPKTMKSKVIDNLYLAGEILNLDGPTGGYNLQVCWSTGYAAGESAGSVTGG
ncbi:TPA: aminoacetone oxidase family FAD-binding enzyme [Candidatus Falkowbacteria bacterium]|nr:aminoacetone oxidase family FAD-binding enzyme [Candidatus Falkowbacteria bacterium]